MQPDASPALQLKGLISERRARIGVIGLGYVGLPLALVAVEAGFPVLGHDINAKRVAEIAAGKQVIRYIPAERMEAALATGRFEVTAGVDAFGDCDVLVICVPTPLTRQREPELSFVVATARTIAKSLRPGQLIVLESTTWPGTTVEVVKPILEETGLVSGRDFFLAFSPEREDPGNPSYSTATIPKVVGGDGALAGELAEALYAGLVERVVPVSSTQTAEAVKLTENIFRAVNIALVNELKTVYAAMGIDIWEVIDAARTKPFGFMPFYPGPAWAGTASRSIRSTSPGRRASSTSRPASSSLPARSTPACPMWWSTGSPPSSMPAPGGACRARASWCWAPPTRRMSTTPARARR